MDVKGGYFIGSLLIGIPYLIFFALRKDLRKEMLFGSFILVPFAFTAPFFIPEYWNPPYLFGYIYPFRIGLEDLIFTFFVGGIAAVIFEFLENRKDFKLKRVKFTRRVHFIPYIIAVILVLGLEFIFPDKSIFNLMVASLIPAVYMIYKRRDLLIQSLTSGFLFSILYFLVFIFFNFLYPNYVTGIYNARNLLGIMIFKVPVEEILFAFATGAGWSIFYEFALNYKTSE